MIQENGENVPFIDGVKPNFKPTTDFECGVGLTTMIGGPGVPFTFHKFVQSFVETSENLARPVFNRDQSTWSADSAAALRSASPRNTVPFSPAMRAVVLVLP